MDSCIAGASVPSIIFTNLQKHPDAGAVHYRDQTISNGRLLHEVQRLGMILQNHEIIAGARVGVCIDRCPDVLVILLALWSRRAVYVALDPALPRERLLLMLAEADLELIITQTDLQALTTSMPCPALVLEPINFREPPADLAPAALVDTPSSLPGDLAYILFTSGSNGTPKGVMISHGNLAVLMQAALPLVMPVCPRVLACASFSFDVALFELLAPLLAGGTVVLADQETCRNPELLAALLRQQGVNLVQASPTMWHLLNRSNWRPAVDDFVAIATGEALPRAVAREILSRSPVLWNLYGPTECTIWASAHHVQPADVADGAPAVVSIGKALPGYRLSLQNAMDRTSKGRGHAINKPESRSSPEAIWRPERFESAELIIEGPAVGLGYCNQPALTARAFAGDPARQQQARRYYSGDLCSLDASGALHFCGRRDNQVKHNGYRVELDEISALLQTHNSISQAVCLLREVTSDQSSMLFACVVPESGMPNKDRQTLNQYLARALPTWMLPQHYYFLDSLPLTANGKIDRVALLALTRPIAPSSHADDSLQSQVSDIFCEILEIEAIGPCDSFFDAGGSSMLGALLVMMLNERFATQISMRQALLTPPTVLGITRLLQGVLQSGQTVTG